MIKRIKELITANRSYEERFNKIELALGRIESRQCSQLSSKSINDYEFKVSSQWGEDGIIQYLIKNIEIENKIFVEFGVETYRESNTRFLLQNDYWSGLVIDGSEENISYIKNDPIYWKHNLKAECAFINKNNINNLITKNGISDDIGILSVDIDGNDYWVWDAINCISPRIVICEYNALFGYKEKVSVPYKEDFHWTNAHFSNLYWGASLPALEYLAKTKGYSLVGVNMSGNNAFFVQNELLKSSNIEVKTSKDFYRYSSFRQSRDEKGKMTYLSQAEALALLSDCTLQNVETLDMLKVSDI